MVARRDTKIQLISLPSKTSTIYQRICASTTYTIHSFKYVNMLEYHIHDKFFTIVIVMVTNLEIVKNEAKAGTEVLF